MAAARPVHRIARELAALLAAAAALAAVAWVTHGPVGVSFVAACWLAGAAAVCLTQLFSPRRDTPYAPVLRYMTGAALRTTLLLAVPVVMLDRAAPRQGTLVLYAFGMLVVLLASEVREAIVANRSHNDPFRPAVAQRVRVAVAQ